MSRPKICVAIVNEDIEAVNAVEPMADLYEVRIDLIGDDWEKVVPKLRKPWIACNRIAAEGGNWQGNEARRVEKLLHAVELGADIVDIELRTGNLDKIVKAVKKRTKCLVSCHDIEKTLPLEELIQIVQRQIDAGADICKVITTARTFGDNVTVLQLIREFPGLRLVSFAMGPLGGASRVMCPLAGGDYTYASVDKGKESAPGQISVRELIKIYEVVKE
jgi:3-dehydroquinate dehydratase type I